MVRVRILSETTRAYDVVLHRPANPEPVRQGDWILVSFFARSGPDSVEAPVFRGYIQRGEPTWLSLADVGGVTTGILNAVVAEDLPGPGTAFLSVEWKFLKAVGIDEEITGRVEVTEVRADKPICKLATEVRNGTG